MEIVAYAAVGISVLALAFSAASFWWLNARRGRLVTYEPTLWAAYVDRERSALRVPLVVHNTGAATAVILAMRVRFDAAGEILDWEWTRRTARPQENDVQDAASAFAIAGRTAVELIPEFLGTFPGVVPEPRAHAVSIDVRSSMHAGWKTIAKFDLAFQNLIHPTNYIVYSNAPAYLSDELREEGAQRLAHLRETFGLCGPAAEGGRTSNR